MFDKELREQQLDYFISNKIKCCRQCGNELDYMEKFHFTDRICCKCKGVESLISVKWEPAQNYNEKTEQFADEQISERYAEWQRLTKLAERKWYSENQSDGTAVIQSKPLKASAESIPSERIFELIGQYDNGEPVAISQEELVSIFWEVLQLRKIIP
ncbi:DUF702 domain-containing protein [Erwiniaceae bacterium L1_54_6]|nr:DUF702 domain-containing protein [Erwiniaceae bacterium L1_54_6]